MKADTLQTKNKCELKKMIFEVRPKSETLLGLYYV